MANEEHMQRVEAHYRALGMENPHASHFAAMRSRGGSKTGGALGSGAKARTGGLGSGKGGSRYENTSAADRKSINSDKSFGYFDETNKRYVPAIIDMIDGGGRNTRGDEFVGGPLSGILNDLGIDPYGSQRERMFVSPNTSPIVQAVNGVGASIDNSLRPQTRPSSIAMQDPRRFDRGSEPRALTSIEAQRATNYLDPRRNTGASGFQQPNIFSDPRNFDPSTEPRELTPIEAQRATNVMDPRAGMGASGFDPDFAAYAQSIQKSLGTNLPPEALQNLYFDYKQQLAQMMNAN
tara:strand:+ start:38 stop:916 length:879 start_codon:yes stop_codon:yes gene_type:complete